MQDLIIGEYYQVIQKNKIEIKGNLINKCGDRKLPVIEILRKKETGEYHYPRKGKQIVATIFEKNILSIKLLKNAP